MILFRQHIIPTMATKQELTTKLVQEIAKAGDDIPEEYLIKNGFPEPINAPQLYGNNLLIDFSLLSSSSSELVKLRSALSEWGCFQVINHGIQSSLQEELIEVSKQFFTLPLEEKLEHLRSQESLEGYGTSTLYEDTQLAGWNDRLFLTLYPEQNRKFQFWPNKPNNFREKLDEYSKKIRTMIEVVYKAMARSLNLEECCFINSLGTQGLITSKISFYPRCSSPKHVLGERPHSDGSIMTIILPQKGVEGLQIEKDELWYDVPATPGALFFNIGDIGEVMTNGVFKSVMHRVVTNCIKERISVAVFCNPGKDEDISPISKMVTNHQPQCYRKFNMQEFMQKFLMGFGSGDKTLDAFRL